MTSSTPLIDLLLERLRALPPGALSRVSRAEQRELDAARATTPRERLEALDDLLRATEALAPLRADLRLIEGRRMLL